MSDIKLWALLMDAEYDGVPVEQYALGVYTSVDEAKAVAKEIFGEVQWGSLEDEDSEDAWIVSNDFERGTLYDPEYNPPIEMACDMIWIRPYEPNRLINARPVFYMDTNLSHAHSP